MSRLFTEAAGADRVAFGNTALPVIGSVACWIYPLNLQSDALSYVYFAVQTDASNLFKLEKISDARFVAGWYSNADYRVFVPAGTYTFTQNAWNLVVCTWDDTANQSILYINNTLAGSPAAALVTHSTTGAKTIGNATAPDVNNSNCRVAEVAIWNRVLTSTERGNLNSFSPANVAAPSGLVDYLPLIGDTSPEPNLAGGTVGTVTGTTQAAHPPMVTTPVYDQTAYRWRAASGSLFAPP